MKTSIRYCQSTILLLLFVLNAYAQQKFKVVESETDSWRHIYSLVNKNGDTLRKLDTSKYYVCFTLESLGFFAIFGKKGYNGWAAIDANEKILFTVYNTSFGEPTPDELIEDKIRIVDTNHLIGFANSKGKIVIPPRFEIVTSFHNGKAIIGQGCKKVPWVKNTTGDCEHYSIICNKHGYINDKGVIKKLGNYSFEEIMKEIDWKEPEE